MAGTAHLPTGSLPAGLAGKVRKESSQIDRYVAFRMEQQRNEVDESSPVHDGCARDCAREARAEVCSAMGMSPSWSRA